MIDLSKVRDVLGDCEDLIASLDGVQHEQDLVEGPMSGSLKRATAEARTAKAERSKALLLLKDRLELAASLVGIEYWYARGEIDPLSPDREDGDDDSRATGAAEG